MSIDDHPSLTRSFLRFTVLLDALRDGPLERAALLERVRDVYPQTDSARPMVDRDCRLLGTLGIVIEISCTRPPVYRLHGGTPNLDTEALRTLALVRDSFGTRHPQHAAVQRVLAQLTERLSEEQRAAYAMRQSSRAPLQPAIDYTPYSGTIARLELAISRREMVAFQYKNTRGKITEHQVEPYKIEYYERHFYLVGYHPATRQILDYRIDRVEAIRTAQTLPPHLSQAHGRAMVSFRYRLSASLAQGAISQRFESQRIIEELPNGDVTIEAEGRSDFFIIQTLLRYRSNAEILEPEWLREKMRAEIAKLVELYGQ